MNTKTTLAVGAVAIVAALLGVGARQWLQNERPGTDTVQQEGLAQTLEAGAPARDAVEQLLSAPLQNLEGQSETLAPFRGQVLVVNFWASWCGPCVAEMPELVRLNDAYAKKGIRFVGIGVDSSQNVQSFLKKTPVDYPILVSGFGGADLARSLGNTAGALPFTVVIDANGAVQSAKLGQVVPAELRKTLDAL